MFLVNSFHFDVPSLSSAPDQGLAGEESIELILEFALQPYSATSVTPASYVFTLHTHLQLYTQIHNVYYTQIHKYIII